MARLITVGDRESQPLFRKSAWTGFRLFPTDGAQTQPLYLEAPKPPLDACAALALDPEAYITLSLLLEARAMIDVPPEAAASLALFGDASRDLSLGPDASKNLDLAELTECP